MSELESTPTEYVVQEIRTALTADARTTELGIEVTMKGNKLQLSGAAASEEHREAIVTIAREHAAGHLVHDNLTVNPMTQPEDEEKLR